MIVTTQIPSNLFWLVSVKLLKSRKRIKRERVDTWVQIINERNINLRNNNNNNNNNNNKGLIGKEC